jgi:hypothetical protein
MNEDNEAAPPAEPAKPSEPLIRQIQPPIQGIKAQVRQIGPIIQAIQGSEALRRQVEPIVQAAEQFVRDARRAKTNGGPGLPFAQRLALAVDAGVRELVPAGERPVVHDVPLNDGGAAVDRLAVVMTITGSGGVVLPKVGLRGQGTAESHRSGLAALSDGQIVFLVLVWLYAFVLPWFGAALSPEFHAVLSDHYATIAIALAITWRIRDKNS